MNTYIIDNFPMPPTVNQLYENNYGKGKSGRRKSKRYIDYIKDCDNWLLANKSKILPIMRFLKTPNSLILRVDTFFKFKSERLFTKDDRVKTLDAHNRIKACHDQLARILETDDKYFFLGDCGKIPVEGEDGVLVRIQELSKEDLVSSIRLEAIKKEMAAK